MRAVVVRLEEHGDGEMVELSKWVFEKEWEVREVGDRIYLKCGDSLTIEMNREAFRSLIETLRKIPVIS